MVSLPTMVDSATMTDFVSFQDSRLSNIRQSHEYQEMMSSSLERVDFHNKHSAQKVVRCTVQQFKHQKPYINFIPLPFCENTSLSEKASCRAKQLPRLRLNKKKIIIDDLPPINIAVDEVPINEYLDYCLTQQINVEMRDAKVLAEEVRRIKEEKKKIINKKPQQGLVTELERRNIRRKRMPLGVLRTNNTHI